MDRETWGTERPSDLVAVDFETFFSKELSLKKLSTWEYVFHPDTFPYMMSVKTEGFEWCGDPKDFDRWDVFEGKVACAHNVSFDGLVWKRLERDGIVPADLKIRRWLCTADLVAYLRVRRNLKDAVKILYGVDLSKKERSDAEGKGASDMKADGTWDAMVVYGLQDSVWCHKIACDYVASWPAKQQFVSQESRESAWRGFAVDLPAIRGRGDDPGALENLRNAVFEFGKAIPWYPDESALSPIALRAQARKDGIVVPASLAKNDERAMAFFEAHKDIPWVNGVRGFRQANMMFRKVETLDRGVREDGTFPYSCVYFGANTGRFTAGVGGNDEEASGKFNLFNLPRGALQGVDLRGLIVPRKGYKFFVGDYAQIEARLLLWRAGEEETLEKIRSGYSVYEAEAEQLLEIDGLGLKERDPEKYHMVKGTVLGCGYQMGPPRFMIQAPALTGGKYKPDAREAKRVVYLYRERHPKIVNYWNRHQTFLMSSAYSGDDSHGVELASGRWLTYYDPTFAVVKDDKTGQDRKEIVVKQIRGEPHKRMYGGKLTENEMQATGFDILVDAWCAISDAGYPVTWTLYDEFVVEVPETDVRGHGEKIAALMTQSSPWAEGLPLGTEWKIADRYFK